MGNTVNYEGMFIINSALGEDGIKKEVDKIKNLISKCKGKLVNEKEIGIKKLAYEINKKREGFYFLLYFTLKPEFIVKLENTFRINDNILRNLIIINELNNFEKKIEKEKTSKE